MLCLLERTTGRSRVDRDRWWSEVGRLASGFGGACHVVLFTEGRLAGSGPRSAVLVDSWDFSDRVCGGCPAVGKLGDFLGASSTFLQVALVVRGMVFRV